MGNKLIESPDFGAFLIYLSNVDKINKVILFYLVILLYICVTKLKKYGNFCINYQRTITDP